MGRSSEHRGPEPIYEVNTTPLIDVSLVLVVILMVAVPMAFQSSIAVQRAASSGSQATPARSERVEVAIVSEDTVEVNRAVLERRALGTVLRPLIASSVTRQVVVRCADQVSHGAFVDVLDEAKASGAAQIAIAGR